MSFAPWFPYTLWFWFFCSGQWLREDVAALWSIDYVWTHAIAYALGPFSSSKYLQILCYVVRPSEVHIACRFISCYTSTMHDIHLCSPMTATPILVMHTYYLTEWTFTESVSFTTGWRHRTEIQSFELATTIPGLWYLRSLDVYLPEANKSRKLISVRCRVQTSLRTVDTCNMSISPKIS